MSIYIMNVDKTNYENSLNFCRVKFVELLILLHKAWKLDTRFLEIIKVAKENMLLDNRKNILWSLQHEISTK
jgi:hypothetical protein